MEVGNQIRNNCNALKLSQEELADSIYVSRQTISNWENNKWYPDIHSLVLLNKIFGTSIDSFIKGDVENMKTQVNIQSFKFLSNMFAMTFVIVLDSPIPLVHFLKFIGFEIWLLLAIVVVYISILFEQKKKEYDIQTYKEMLAFVEEKELDKISRAKEEGKRLYQKIMLLILFMLITVWITIAYLKILY